MSTNSTLLSLLATQHFIKLSMCTAVSILPELINTAYSLVGVLESKLEILLLEVPSGELSKS